MTPQEQYPNFYEKPHLWINAIEVECVKQPDNKMVALGKREKLTRTSNYTIAEWIGWEYFKPLFKPQEGKAFIKDLEQAVSAATGLDFKYYDINKGCHRLLTTEQTYTVKMPIIKIRLIKAYETETGKHLPYFDTAAYVDKLRELGYYL